MDLNFDTECLHKKTGKKYLMSNKTIINCTNSNDQEKMIIYTDGEKLFVREYAEFLEKFLIKF